MEFDLGGEAVTLLHFTPLSTSDTYYGANYTDSHTNEHSRSSAGHWDTSNSYGGLHHSYNTGEVADVMTGVSSMEVSATPSPIPPPAPATVQSMQQQPSPYFSPSDSYSGMHSTETQACQSPYYMTQSQQYSDYIHSPQVASPAVSVTNTGYDSPTVDLETIEMLLNGGADLGPQPVRLPRLEEEPPRSKESAYSSNLLISQNGVRSTPHSPSDMRIKSETLKATRRGRSVSSSKSSRGTIKRASSPVFPDYSTPLSSVSLSRHPSITSLCSSTKSDPFSTVAASVRSDPGPYRIQHSSGDSAIDSPAMSLQNSPKFVFNSSSSSSTQNIPVSIDNSSRSCIEIAMPVKFAKKITDLDKKIWRLQAERSKLLEKAHQTKSIGPMDGVHEGDFDSRLLTEKSSEIGRVHLYVFPLGIHAIDEQLYEEANMILRQVGGLFFDYQSAVDNLRSICCKGMVRLPDISTCFAYIKSLLNVNQKLKLVNSIGGLYKIQLDLEESVPGQMDGIVPTEFVESLRVANEVMRCAQHITKVYPTVHMQLQQVRQMAAAKFDRCDSICQELGIMDRERRTQIKSVLDGNCTIMASAERVWPQYYQIATETIRTITGCIHPQT